MQKIILMLLYSIALIDSVSSQAVRLCYPLPGWTPESRKKIILSSDKEINPSIKYSVMKDSVVVKSGSLSSEGYYWGFYLYSADISDITTEGGYIIKVPDYAEGYVDISNYIYKKFRSKNNSYIGIRDMLSSFWNYQRCYPEKCNNPNYDKHHEDDNNLPLYTVLPNDVKSPVEGKSKELRGGWHDATSTDKESFDIGEAVSHMAIAILNMKDTAILRPLMDELRWGTDYLLKLQEDDGSFCVQIWNYQDWVQNAPPRHLAINKGIGVAARCALGLITAAEVYKDIDTVYSNRCTRAARKAWEYADTHPYQWMQDTIATQWTGNAGTLIRTIAELSITTKVKGYCDTTDQRIKEGGFNHTVHYSWGDYVVKGIWAKQSGTFPGQIKNDWVGQYEEVSGGHAAIGLARYYNNTNNNTTRELIRQHCIDYINWVKEGSDNPFGVCTHFFNPWIGMSQNYSSLALNLIHVGIELDIPEAIELGVRNYEWIIGFNPFGASCVVGIGDSSIVQPYMRPADSTIGGIVPGMLYRERTVAGVKENYLTLDWENKETEPWSQWKVGEAGMGAAALIELTALLNKLHNPSDQQADLPVISNNKRITDESIDIFPNPSSGIIYFKHSWDYYRYQLLNQQGIPVMDATLGANQQYIDISSLPSGTYLLLLWNKSGVITKKIIRL